jgi:hypothetical protein
MLKRRLHALCEVDVDGIVDFLWDAHSRRRHKVGDDFVASRCDHHDTEVPLYGHATLASAAVIMERLEPDRRRVV